MMVVIGCGKTKETGAVFLFLICFFLLGACNEIPVTPASKTPYLQITSIQPSTLTSTQSPSDFGLPTPIPGLTAARGVTKTPELFTVPQRQVSVTPGLLICSPLEAITIDELKGIISRPFQVPRVGRDDGHHGVDFAYFRRGDQLSIFGIAVKSVLPGKVAGVGPDRFPYGNYMIIETPTNQLNPAIPEVFGISKEESLYILYAHMAEVPDLESGEKVGCGRVLGRVGNSGSSGNPHLHLEIRIGPTDQDIPPMAFYDTQATTEERDAYQMWRMSGLFRLIDPMVLLTFDP